MLRRKAFWFALCFLMMVVLYLSMSLPVKRQLRWVDANTVSVKTQMQWFGRWKADPVIEVSALEKWAREHDQFKGYEWHSSWSDPLTVWGISMKRGGSISRPMFDGLQGDRCDFFVGKATAEQLRAYMHTMYHGSDEEREQAYQDIFDFPFLKPATLQEK